MHSRRRDFALAAKGVRAIGPMETAQMPPASRQRRRSHHHHHWCRCHHCRLRLRRCHLCRRCDLQLPDGQASPPAAGRHHSHHRWCQFHCPWRCIGCQIHAAITACLLLQLHESWRWSSPCPFKRPTCPASDQCSIGCRVDSTFAMWIVQNTSSTW